MLFVSRRKSSPSKRAAVPVERDEAAGTLTARPSGKWSISDGLDDAGTLEKALAETRGARRLKFDCAGVSSYDSSLVCYVLRCVALCREKEIEADLSTLPDNLRRLAELALVGGGSASSWNFSARPSAPSGGFSAAKRASAAAICFISCRAAGSTRCPSFR